MPVAAPAFGSFGELKPCSQQPDQNLLRLAHTAKLPAHSSCIVIHQLSLCLLLRNTSQHLFQLCHPAISHRRHSRRHSKESHGALTTFLTPLTLQQPQRHPESTPAPFSSDILQPNGLLQRGPQPYLPPEAGSLSSN